MKKETAIKGSKGEIVLYRMQGGRTELGVRLEADTLWLTQKQIAELFETERSVITKHVRNIFVSGELEEKSNVQKMHIAGSDKPVAFYNLDVIISVGYRVNSLRGTQFRIWATQVLKEHLVKGYTANERRLKELRQSLKLVGQVLDSVLLHSEFRNPAQHCAAIKLNDRVYCKRTPSGICCEAEETVMGAVAFCLSPTKRSNEN